MIRSALKLVWRRKRQNSLLILEIFVSFLVVFVVATLGLHLYHNYRLPLGFEYENVWVVSIATNHRAETAADEEFARFGRLLDEARALDSVEAVAASSAVPYEMGGDYGAWKGPSGRGVEAEFGTATDGLREVLGLELVAGRWFEPADEALAWIPAVIDQSLARELYGEADPVGRPLRERDAESGPEERVVGVVGAFRKRGELLPQGFFAFRRMQGQSSRRLPSQLLLRVRPGSDARLEEALAKRLQAVAPDWSFQIQALPQARATTLRMLLAPLLAGGVVSAFLLLMVALGLSGVLWQNVIARTQEIGLRRAVGATRGQVLGQIVLEIGLVALLGVGLGAALVVQAPLLGAADIVPPAAFARGLGASAVAMLALACGCGLYPGWLSSRVRPAEALHDE